MTPTLQEQTAALRHVVTEKRRAGEDTMANALQAALSTLVARAAGGGHVGPAADLANLPQATLTLYKQFEGAFHDFCLRETGGRGKMDSVEGRALNSIIQYLTENCRTRDGAGALESWKYVLSHWHQLSDFLQKQKTPRAINRYLTEILETIRKANQPARRQPATPDNPQAAKLRAKLLDELSDVNRSIHHLESCTPYDGQAAHLAQAEARKVELETRLAALA